MGKSVDILSQGSANMKKNTYKRWTDEENKLYAKFILDQESEGNIETNFSKRLPHKFFHKMASAIKTKTHRQCKTHHQKMMLIHNYIEGKASPDLSQSKSDENESILQQ